MSRKIIRIIARLNIGGPAIHAILLTEGLNRDNFESYLVCGSVSEGEADMAYFRVGESFGYIPSANWTSSFLGHDDNFGPCFCVPRLYISNDKVDYVAELLKPGIRFMMLI